MEPWPLLIYVDEGCDEYDVTSNILRMLHLSYPTYPTSQGDVIHLCQCNGKQQMKYSQFYAPISHIPQYEDFLEMVAMTDPYHCMEMTPLCEPMPKLLSFGPDLSSHAPLLVSDIMLDFSVHRREFTISVYLFLVTLALF